MNREDRSDALRTAAIVLAAAIVVAMVRGPLSEANQHVRETSDLYALPPPRELVTLSLGYRSALADVLWAHLLVSQGLHTEQHRRYDNLIRLLDAINELEPTYRDPYRFAESLITFQSAKTPEEEVRAARAIMERGVAARPLDADLWLELGEFVAFVAPGTYLTDPAEQEAWQRDGAKMLAQAAELSGDDATIAWQAIGAARILSKEGERDAEIRFLTRTLAVTDDPELQKQIKAKLVVRLGAKQQEENDRVDEAIKAVRVRDMPQIMKRSEYMLLGPPRDPAYCAGEAHEHETACATTWREWEERFKQSGETKAQP